MKQIFILFLLLPVCLLASNCCFSQKTKAVYQELFEPLAFKDSSGIYYITDSTRTKLSAYNKDTLLWKTDIGALFGRADVIDMVGIRDVRFDMHNNKLFLTYGKHCFFAVNRTTGEAIFTGCD